MSTYKKYLIYTKKILILTLLFIIPLFYYRGINPNFLIPKMVMFVFITGFIFILSIFENIKLNLITITGLLLLSVELIKNLVYGISIENSFTLLSILSYILLFSILLTANIKNKKISALIIIVLTIQILISIFQYNDIYIGKWFRASKKMFGTIGLANFLAAFLAIGLTYCITNYHFYRSGEILKTRNKLIFITLSIIHFIIIYLSNVRTALFTTVIIIFLYLLWLSHKYKHYILTISLVLIMCVGIIINKQYFVQQTHSLSVYDRMLQWKTSGDILRDNPLLGIGVTRYGKKYMEYQKENTYLPLFKRFKHGSDYVHNEIIQLLTEFGILGFGFIILVFYYILKQSDTKFKFIFITLFFISLFSFPLHRISNTVLIIFLYYLSNPKMSFVKISTAFRKVHLLKIFFVIIGLLNFYIAANTFLYYKFLSDGKKYTELDVRYARNILFNAFDISDNAEVISAIARTYYDEHRYTKALEYYKKIIDTDIYNGSHFNNAAVSFYKFNQINNAINCANKYNFIWHYNWSIFNTLGECYRIKNNVKKSERYYTKALKLTDSSKNKAVIYNNIGSLYGNNKLYNKAKKYFTQAVQLDPDFERAQKNLNYLKRIIKLRE